MPRRRERTVHSPPDGLSGSRLGRVVGALFSAGLLLVGTAMFIVFPLWFVFGLGPDPHEGDDTLSTRLFLLGAVAFFTPGLVIMWGRALGGSRILARVVWWVVRRSERMRYRTGRLGGWVVLVCCAAAFLLWGAAFLTAN
jgi:hypothetical protein